MELAEMLRELETELLKPSTRENAAALASILADEFREYGSSGRMSSKADIIELLQSESSADICTDNFEAQILATGVALATYRAAKKDPGSAPATSLRSSIWIFRDNRWQMLFHHGTKVSQSV